ncbi:MAG TPA: glycosyltransferase family 2 protein [Acidimicrobiales bacterium]|jgi:glycosyltransferase involved in cell wall biosynthesis|nr:glycosyltransferase family 2 protein [Acidimicrobiales bacterium]
MDLTIVMPVFNEEATIVEAAERALDAGLPASELELVIVDDGSSDRTVEQLRAHSWPSNVQIIELGENHGKGYAVRKGAERANGRYVAVLDADFEYDPRDFAKMLPALEQDDVDAVIGTRLWQAHTAFGYWYVIGNKVINTICNALYNTYLSDFGACLKVVPTELFRELDLRENGFGFDAELVARLLRRKAKIYEVPVHYRARRREEGKKINAMDGVKILGVFIRCRVR